MPRAFLVKKKAKLNFDLPDELHYQIGKEARKKEADCREKNSHDLFNEQNKTTSQQDSGIPASSERVMKGLPCLTIPKPFHHDQTGNVLRSILYRGPRSPTRKLNDINDKPSHVVKPRTAQPLMTSAHSAFDKVIPGVPRSGSSADSAPPSQINHISRLSSQLQFEQLHRRDRDQSQVLRHSDGFKSVLSFRQRGEGVLQAELANNRKTSADEPLNLKVSRHDDSSRPNSVESTTSDSRDSVSPPQNERYHIPKKKYFLDRESFPMASDRDSSIHNNFNVFALRTPRYTPSVPQLGPDPRSHLNWAFAAYYQQPSYGGPYSSFYSRVNRYPGIPDDMHMLHRQAFHSYTSQINSSLKKDISEPSSGKTSPFNNSSPSPTEFHDDNDNQPPKSPESVDLETVDTERSLLKPEYREYLTEHLNNVRTDAHTPHSSTTARPVARQPILGLEYIQNGQDVKVNDVDPEDDEEEIDEQEGECNQQINAEHIKDPNGQDNEGLPNDMIGNVGSRMGMPRIGDHQPLIPPPATATVKPSQPKKYKCDVCFKGFSRSNTLVTHKRIHTGDKPFKCELCGRAFRQPGNLTRHRLTHTTVKPYVCPQCDKAFNRASNLHTHMRTHTNYKPFTCPFCGKGFHQKIDMKIHSYTHTGEKPHKCKTCGRGFKQLTHLTYHLRTHSAVKMYTCAYCGKGFNQKGNLQAHIYGHTGERPYRCEICDKGFTLASTLNTHRRTHAEKKPFQCQYCQKDFYQKNALKSHLIASHPYTGESLL